MSSLGRHLLLRRLSQSGASSSQPSFSRDEVISLPSDSDDEGFPDMDTVFNNISSSQAARKPDRPASQARGPRTSLPSSSQPNPSSSSASSKARTSLAPKRKPPMDRSARAAASPDSSEPALEGRKRLRARVSSASTAPSAGPSSAKKSKPTTPSPVKGMATAADPIMLSDSDDASESDSPPPPKTRKPGPRPVVNAAPSKRTSLSASQSPQQPEPTSAQRQEPLFDRGSIASDAGTDPLAEGGSVDDHLMDVDLEGSPTTSQDTANLHPEDAQISPPPSSSRTSATEELVVEDLSNDTARAETPSMVRDRPGHQSASPSPPTSDQPGPSLRAQQTDAEEADELDEALRMSEDATVQALAELPGEDVYLVPAMAASSGPRSDQASVSPRRMEERPTLSAKAKGKQRAQVVATPTRPSTIGLKEPTSAALASPRPLVVRSITSDTAVSSLARASRSSSASSSASRTSLALDASLSPGPPSAPLAPLRAFSHLQQQDDDFKPVFAPLVARASSGPPTHLMFLPSLEYNHPQPNITIRTADEREIRTRTELLFAVADVFEDFFLREDWEETLDEGVDGLRVLYLGASERMVGLLLYVQTSCIPSFGTIGLFR